MYVNLITLSVNHATDSRTYKCTQKCSCRLPHPPPGFWSLPWPASSVTLDGPCPGQQALGRPKSPPGLHTAAWTEPSQLLSIRGLSAFPPVLGTPQTPQKPFSEASQTAHYPRLSQDSLSDQEQTRGTPIPEHGHPGWSFSPPDS